MIDVTQFKIDKKIPIPDKDKKGMRLLESKMKIGDSSQLNKQFKQYR